VESILYHLGGTFRGTYYTLNDNIINGRIRGIAGVVGCNNARTGHNEGHIAVVKELIKNDVIVLTTGCNGIACAMEGLLTPESAAVSAVRVWPRSARPSGIPPVLHLGSCVDNSRILLAATEVVKAGGLGNDISDLPAAGSAPEWMSEKAISIGQYFVASGVYTVFGAPFPTCGRPGLPAVSVRRAGKDLRRYVGFRSRSDQACSQDDRPYRQAKRKGAGHRQGRERVLMDMARPPGPAGITGFFS
jgi:anaerobic carbon-monoxide dehydrogenase catalytic subunit